MFKFRDFRRFLSFEWKVGLIVLAIFATVLPILLAGRRALETVETKNRDVIERFALAVSRTERLRYIEADETAFAELYILTANDAFLKKVVEKRAAFYDMVGKLNEVLINASDIETLRTVVRSKAQHDSVADLGLGMRESGLSLQQIHALIHKHRRDPSEVEFGSLDAFAAHMLDELGAAKRSSAQSTNRLINQFTISSIGTLCALTLFAIMLLLLLRQNARHSAERAKLYERLKRLAGARKEAVEVVSHDLQTPLTSLLLRMQLLQRKIEIGRDGHVDIHKDVERVVATAQGMKDLIRNLLDQAKIEAGSFTLDLSSHEIEPILEDTIELFQPVALEKSIALVLNLDGHLPKIEMDVPYIQRAVTNLISNALKFTSKGGRIEVGAKIDTDLTIWVRDNGSGIAEDQLPYIFNRFWQSQPTKRQGTGLGLSIVKGIVEAHGGRVRVESESGIGTCVQISMPLRQSQLNWKRMSSAGKWNR